MLSCLSGEHSALHYQRRPPTDSVQCGARFRHVGHDYVTSRFLPHIPAESRPTSNGILPHFKWNQCPTSNGINAPLAPEYAVHKLITEIPVRVVADSAYQNASKNSDKQNARVEHDSGPRRKRPLLPNRTLTTICGNVNLLLRGLSR
jgi:hypothetical protein